MFAGSVGAGTVSASVIIIGFCKLVGLMSVSGGFSRAESFGGAGVGSGDICWIWMTNESKAVRMPMRRSAVLGSAAVAN